MYVAHMYKTQKIHEINLSPRVSDTVLWIVFQNPDEIWGVIGD